MAGQEGAGRTVLPAGLESPVRCLVLSGQTFTGIMQACRIGAPKAGKVSERAWRRRAFYGFAVLMAVLLQVPSWWYIMLCEV